MEWVVGVDALGRAKGVRVESVGGVALSLACVAAAGVPVPDTIVLTT